MKLHLDKLHSQRKLEESDLKKALWNLGQEFPVKQKRKNRKALNHTVTRIQNSECGNSKTDPESKIIAKEYTVLDKINFKFFSKKIKEVNTTTLGALKQNSAQ